MKNVTLSLEKLAGQILTSYKLNSQSEHMIVCSTIRNMVGDSVYDEICTIAKGIISGEKKAEPKKAEDRYKEVKEKNPEAIILMRCGDFYETYNEDAVEVAKILGITLTSRNNEKNEKVAGFPHHALDTYLPKLVRAGKRVAITE